jgi:phosphatidylglycerol lysyltransferase
MGATWRRLAPILGVALLLAALLVLRRELQQLRFADLSHALGALPVSVIALAVGLTLLNYAVLTGYDQLAFVYLGRKFPRWQIGMASFVGYAISNNLGFALLSGTSARYRFYSRWGLTAQDLSRIVVFYSGTFWVGLLALGGWSLLVNPPGGLTNAHFHAWAVPVGAVLVTLAAAYAVSPFLRKTPIKLGSFELPLPSARLVAGQFTLSILDWTLAVAVFWVLIPAPRPPFVVTVSAFLASQILGLASNLPGGLVVFETAMVMLLPGTRPAALLSALVAFRAIYYLLPLVLALVVLLVDESYQRRHVVRRWGNAFGTLAISLTPKVLAVLTFLGGAILLFSGATPGESARLRILANMLPLPVVEVSHFLGSLVGLGLLLVSQALMRRVDAAWTLSVLGLVVGIAASLLKGLDYEEASLLAVFLVLLLSARREFDRRATLFERRFSPLWFTTIILVVLGSVVLGEFAFRQVQYSDQLWWRFAFRADAPRFLRATVGVAVVLFVLGLRQLLRPAAPRLRLPAAEDFRAVGPVIETQRSASAYLVYLGDKAILWNDDRSAFLLYAIQGRTWVALHDPVGPPMAVPALIRRFLEMVDDSDGVPVFYEVRKDYLHRYADFGLAFAKAGESALVPLRTFSLEGGARKKMRTQYRKLLKDGASFRIVAATDVRPLLPELRAISDEWLTAKASAEKGFSLGFFDDEYLCRFPVALLEVGGRIEAFANLWPGAGKVELSVDLMRQRSTAPTNAVEGLFLYLMLWGRDEGYEWFDLGMAPLSGLEATATAPLRLRLASYLYRHGQPFYNFQGLRAYKDKFDPLWEPKYLAYPGGLGLPRILADVSALIAGGYRGIVMR